MLLREPSFSFQGGFFVFVFFSLATEPGGFSGVVLECVSTRPLPRHRGAEARKPPWRPRRSLGSALGSLRLAVVGQAQTQRVEFEKEEEGKGKRLCGRTESEGRVTFQAV